MSNTTKMYASNSKARRWLKENKYRNIHLFPHTRFVKDFHLEDCEFDGIASIETRLVLFQIKTNSRCTKKTLSAYKELEKKFGIVCLWINIAKGKIEVNNE